MDAVVLQAKSQIEVIDVAIERYVSTQMQKLRGTFARKWPPIDGMTEPEALDEVVALLVEGCRDTLCESLGQPLAQDQERHLGVKVRGLPTSKFQDWKRFITMDGDASNTSDSRSNLKMNALTKRGMSQPSSSKRNQK